MSSGEADEMRVRHTELSESPDLLERREPRSPTLHDPVNHVAGVALASERGWIDSAADEKFALARRYRVSMPTRHRFKMGDVFVSKRDSKFDQVEFLRLAPLIGF